MSSSDPDDYSKTHCDSCVTDIPGIGIECVECKSVQLCCECFGLGAEIGRHKSSHRYRFFDASGDIFLYPKDPAHWTSKENLRLLQGIETFGHADWNSIKQYIESESSDSTRVKLHTDPKTGKETWPVCKSLEPEGAVYDCLEDDGPLSPITNKVPLSPPLDIAPDEASKLGLFPLTDDYENEHDNDAEEELVAHLKYNPDDEEIDKDLQLALIDIYANRLAERKRRKDIIRDYQLTREFFKKKTSRIKNGISIVEKNLKEVLRPFAQFHTAQQHSHIINKLMKERELTQRMQKLIRYRENGITKADECMDFDKFCAKKAENEKSNFINRMLSSLTHAQGTDLSNSASNFQKRRRKRRRLLLSHQKSHTAEVLRRRHPCRVYNNNVNGLRKRKRPGTSTGVSVEESPEEEEEGRED